MKVFWSAGTNHRSQVIVLGCFNIGKTMACDLWPVTCDLWPVFCTCRLLMQSLSILLLKFLLSAVEEQPLKLGRTVIFSSLRVTRDLISPQLRFSLGCQAAQQRGEWKSMYGLSVHVRIFLFHFKINLPLPPVGGGWQLVSWSWRSKGACPQNGAMWEIWSVEICWSKGI